LAATFASVLNHHDDGNTWRLKRRIGDEPGMMAVLFRQVLLPAR
jgi:hypothetical protein